MAPKATRRFLAVHRVTGAFVALNFLVLSLTGVLLVFHEEIDHATGHLPPDSASSAAFRPLADLVASARVVRPSAQPLYVFFEEGKPGVAHVGMAAAGVTDLEKAVDVMIDARTAKPLGSRRADSGFTAIVLKIHSELFLGPFGKLLVGVIGLALLCSLCTGLVAYGPTMRRFSFGMLRRGGRRSLLFADWHRLVGASLSGWLVVVVLTGVLLTVGTMLIQLFQMTTLAEMTSSSANRPPVTQYVPLTTVVSRAKQAFPNDELAFVTFPGTDFSGKHHFSVFTRAESGLARKVFKVVLVDAESGELTAARELPWFIKMLLLSEPLHFGDYGGLPLKLIWALFGLGSTSLSATGLYVLVARRWAPKSTSIPAPEPTSAPVELGASNEA